jgi:hypothetical protein
MRVQWWGPELVEGPDRGPRVLLSNNVLVASRRAQRVVGLVLSVLLPGTTADPWLSQHLVAEGGQHLPAAAVDIDAALLDLSDQGQRWSADSVECRLGVDSIDSVLANGRAAAAQSPGSDEAATARGSDAAQPLALMGEAVIGGARQSEVGMKQAGNGQPGATLARSQSWINSKQPASARHERIRSWTTRRSHLSARVRAHRHGYGGSSSRCAHR